MASTKIVFQLDAAGAYVGEADAFESPLEPGVFHLPAGCVEDPPPPAVEGKERRYLDGAWGYVDIIPPDEPEAPEAPELTLGEQKMLRLANLNELASGLANSLTAGYPEFEKLTWEQQRIEVLAWQADPDAPTPFLDALAENREMERTEFLTRTLVKVQAFIAASQKLVGQRQKFEDRIMDAVSPAQLAAIEFVFNLA